MTLITAYLFESRHSAQDALRIVEGSHDVYCHRHLWWTSLQVVLIGKTAVGIGMQCDDPKCEWDSVPFMQRNYTSGHRQLMLDCLGVNKVVAEPSQQGTHVTIVQRRLTTGRAMLNMLEVQEAVEGTGADVHIMSLEGLLSCRLQGPERSFFFLSTVCHRKGPRTSSTDKMHQNSTCHERSFLPKHISLSAICIPKPAE